MDEIKWRSYLWYEGKSIWIIPMGTLYKKRSRQPSGWQEYDTLFFKNEIVSARLLANGATLKTELTGDGLIINVPENALDPNATVIKCEVKGIVETVSNKPKDKLKPTEQD